jgi:hypothetical protein
MLMTPWALTTFGAATAEAVAAATFRKLRRVGRPGFDGFVMAFLSLCSAAALAPADFLITKTACSAGRSNSIAAARINARMAHLSAPVTPFAPYLPSA